MVEETHMAENSSGDGNGALYFIVGGLVVVAALGAFAYHGGYFEGRFGHHDGRTTTEQTTTTPGHGETTTTTTSEKSRP
jgi:hypothetical protein